MVTLFDLLRKRRLYDDRHVGLSMPQQIDRDHHAFGPRALNCLVLAFDRAWSQLRSEGIDTDTPAEIELIRTKLAQSIIACATAREYDVEQLKEVGLMGFRWVREFSDDGKLKPPRSPSSSET
jgi:hypothetical protein